MGDLILAFSFLRFSHLFTEVYLILGWWRWYGFGLMSAAAFTRPALGFSFLGGLVIRIMDLGVREEHDWTGLHSFPLSLGWDAFSGVTVGDTLRYPWAWHLDLPWRLAYCGGRKSPAARAKHNSNNLISMHTHTLLFRLSAIVRCPSPELVSGASFPCSTPAQRPIQPHTAEWLICVWVLFGNNAPPSPDPRAHALHPV